MGVFDDLQAGLDTIGGFDVNDGADYYVDIVMCIDATGSMSPIIEEVKANAMAFCEKFHEEMDANGKNVAGLRIKVIPFRDYACDGTAAMDQSEFFVLPEQNEEFRSYVMGIRAAGGGDEPENALEAMALAMRSAWTTDGVKQRHVILMLTDASAVPLGDPFRTSSPSYPKDMPASLAELYGMWEDMPSKNSARLVLFAPEAYPWTDLMDWNNVWACFCQPGGGLGELDFDMITQVLVSAV